MHVYGPAHLHGPQAINPPHAARMQHPAPAAESAPIQDELHLSEAGQLMSKAHELPEIRWDRVNQIRAQIADGTYETDDKLRIAIGRLFDEIG